MSRLPHQPEPLNVDTGPMPEKHALAVAETELREITENTLKLADKLGYDGPLTLGGAEDHARMQMRRTVNECLELGKTLLIIRELTPHGGFMDRVELLGISHSAAKRFMQATLKFSNGAAPRLLAAAGNQTKLLELLVLDSDEIKELSENGSTRGIELDDIARMSAQEVRAALRESRETLEARSEVIAKKESRINALEEDLHKARRRLETQTPDEVGEQLRQETAGIGWSIVGRMNVDLAQAFEALDQHGRDNDCTHEEFMAGVLFDIQRALHAIRETHAVKERPDGDARPDWTRPDYNPQLDADTEASRQRFIKEHGYDPLRKTLGNA